MSAVHTITIEPMGDDDYPEWTLHCPGVTPSCSAWLECVKCRDLTEDQEEKLDEDGVLHGVEHLDIDGLWMTATDSCLLCIGDVEFDMNLDRYLPGTYPIDWEYVESGSYVTIDMAKPMTGPVQTIADALTTHTFDYEFGRCHCGFDVESEHAESWHAEFAAHLAAVIAALDSIAVVELPKEQVDSFGDSFWLIEADGPIVHQKVSLRDGKAFLSVHSVMRPDLMLRAAVALLAAARAAGGES